jgi:hypothetical protein
MKDVPEDFPRGRTAPTVPGAQPKFIARKIEGRYVVGLTEAELHDRWDYCEDLALQLAARTLRKQTAGLVSDLDAFYRETEHRVRGQGWDLSNDEVIWLMKRTRALAEYPTPSSPEG